MKKIPLLLTAVTMMLSCVSTTNNNTESRESILIKKSLILLNFEQSTLKSVKQDKKFLSSKNEKLTPSRRLIKKYNVETEVIQDRNVHIISPKLETSEMVVLYLHGGAYMTNFLSIHWDFIDELISSTGATVIAPDYPLAPEATWEDAFSILEPISSKILTNYNNVVFMGDSAGAGLALSWTMELKRRHVPLPNQLILLSPWLDVSMGNQDITAAEEKDPYLSREALTVAGRYWAGGNKTNSWQVSPINGDLEGLPPITLFTGTADILNPDARLFKSKMFDVGSPLDYREYMGMMHDWMFFSMPEADEAFSEVAYLLNS